MSELNGIVAALRRLAQEKGFALHGDDSHLTIQTNGSFTTINLVPVSEDAAFVYLYCRTTSWDWPGERTDANDIVSVLLACYLRGRDVNFSSTLWNVYNPAVEVPPTEVYARYVTLDQPSGSIFRADAGSLQDLSSLLDDILRFEILFPYLFMWEKGDMQDWSYSGEVREWAEEVATVLGEPLDDRVQYNRRWGPDWYYYRSLRRRISVIGSGPTAVGLELLFRGQSGHGNDLKGINRRLHVSSRVTSAVPLRAEAYARRILRALHKGDDPGSFSVTPLENRVVFTGGVYVIVLERNCGSNTYKDEVRRIEVRHRREAAVLFAATAYEWSERIDDERFELLIRDLLARERGVLWVRKCGHSRDSDGGKDLLAEWLTPPPPNINIPEGVAPAVRRRVVVQAKAVSRSVNKEMVRDIRDTLEANGAKGFFLAVSSHLTSDLTDHLERLRAGQEYWAEWWNRSEIEERLNANRDIAERYSDIVRRVD